MEKRRFTIVIVFAAIAIVGLVAVNGYLLMNQGKKIAYVRSYELINKYQGTLEARANFEKQKTGLMANVDSLRLNFERAKSEYLSNASGMAQGQRMEHERILGQQQNQLMQYGEAIDQKIQEEDARMMQEVLNQINSFVEAYALQEGYEIILGTTLSGNLLFGDKSLDITEPVLAALNTQYKGK